MKRNRVLLLYISEHSGHHCASNAIEKALRSLDPTVEVKNINSFNYTNPILEKIINRAYMGVVKRTPELWDYLYDNPKVVRSTQKLRDMIHRFNKGKLKTLLDDFAPDAIACTQAFPCGLIADYKKSFGLDIPLVGVLTDYAPHSYWVYNNVDRYVVPSEATGGRLVANGVEPSKIAAFGIPIDPKFKRELSRDDAAGRLGIDSKIPTILVMGGTQGLGPIVDIIRSVDRSGLKVQILVAAGTNRKLCRWLDNERSRNKVLVFPQASNVDELMAASDLIITKPGGITTAEALAKGLPMLIVHPLPGQEAMNTTYLLNEGVAVKAESPEDAAILLAELLYNEKKLEMMAQKALSLAKAESAVHTAELLLELIKR